MDVELIIKKQHYKEIKNKKIDTRDYHTEIKINNKKYNCIFDNYNIANYDNGIPIILASKSKIEVLNRFEDEDVIQCLSLNMKFDIKINNEIVSYYPSFTKKRDLFNDSKIYIDDLKFIEY